MIITTTSTVSGARVTEYKGLVHGQVITGINVLKDVGAGLRNFFGGRSEGYENELITARQGAIDQMIANAEQIGANAVIGIDIDYEVLGADNNMLMVTVNGTACIVQRQ